MEFQLTPEIRLNPFPMYALMRQSGGVLHIAQHGLWNVFRYGDVKAVLTDYKRFSSRYGPEDGGVSPLITTDPPRHTKLRSLVSHAFTPRAVAALEGRIASMTHQLLDRVVPTGRIDLVQDLAAPLPVMVIAEMLGIPPEDRDRFKRWSDQVVASADTLLGEGDQGAFGSSAAMTEMAPYFHQIFDQRLADPQDDLISGLLAAELDGERLTPDEIFSFCWLLLVAGNETTTNLITNAILAFLEWPDQWERLRHQPDLLPSAIEEALRYRSPVQAMVRVAVAETEMGGHTIGAGERVIAWMGSANRDEEQFSDPDRFDIGRHPNPHIAFGHGIHFCLGAPLARLEARIVLGAILERLQGLRRIDDAPLEPVSGFIVHGVRHLPLAFG